MSEGFIIGNGGGGLAFGYIAALVPTDAESLICRMYANEQRTQLIGSIDGGAGIAAGQFLFHIPVRCWCEVEAARTLAGGTVETKKKNVNVLTRGKIERALLGWKTWLYAQGDSETFALWQKTADQMADYPTMPTISNEQTGMKIIVSKSESTTKANGGGASLIRAVDLSQYSVLRFNVEVSSATDWDGEELHICETDPHAGIYRLVGSRNRPGKDIDITNINGEKYILVSLYSYKDSPRNYCIIKEVYLE